MANEKNLIPFTSDQSREEAKKNGKKGGKKSGEKRREKKLIRDALREVLNEPAAPGSNKSRLEVLAADALSDLHEAPDIRKLKVLAEILGELEQNVNLSSNESGLLIGFKKYDD